MARMNKELLQIQLSELEMLASMFPGDGEFLLDHPSMLDDVSRYIDGQREAKPRLISFTINIQLEENESCKTKARMELCSSLPYAYPEVAPEVFARGSTLSRPQQKKLNDDLSTYVDGLDRGDVCMTSVVMWLQENAASFIDDDISDTAVEPCCSGVKRTYTGLSRLWIYSHHIYRKELLKKIVASAKELDLCGFVLPGKPGIICIEGYKENCDEYWQRVKYPNWKHISCKHREEQQLSINLDYEQQRREFNLFDTFQELIFEAHGDYGLRNDYHMDLGKFRTYLQNHGCEHVFTIFFGFENKESKV